MISRRNNLAATLRQVWKCFELSCGWIVWMMSWDVASFRGKLGLDLFDPLE